ncbi:MAG: hypothetical protein R2764_11260 [Bacteroidales bacterium]
MKGFGNIDGLKDSDKFDLQVQLILLAAQFDSRIEPHPISKQELASENPFVAEIRKTGKGISIENIKEA